MVVLRLALLLALLLVALTLLGRLVERARRRPRAVPARGRRAGSYDWEPRTDRVYRQLKGVPRPQEDREGIIRFIESRRGVEAYVEPRTVVYPLSVVLVAEDGEWVRFELADDALLRELARTRGLAVHDAVREGYPRRMREYRRKDRPPQDP